MFEISEEQEALLRLPDPSTFFPLLCREIREEYPGRVGHLSDGALMDEVVRSHDHAAYVLRITHLPVLVRWVKADVAWACGLRAVPAVGMWIRNAEHPNLAAADLLSNLAGY
ncbi:MULTISPECIES: hypothetical protein [Stenotrophomonas]|uniref:hypothetical protein n=1 Tax=Stenotrophomonas TaxID=40323 RepID=UPI000DB5BE79|nr:MULTISPECIES: hypothetical protein [Stenotrophomonas]MBA0431889.1 hypothetical protein [Stenotrophomonas maltophilia]MDH0274238.1 hypothetical protein [Stenotrophomonas sp. GD04089]MDH1912356.1 hypothetical protein [Stenotrophomonas sp. GD03794]PZP80277.1 MAG: hypothetical protein DI592_12515 [Stenotrophomonas maltophilia]UQA69140.1 hypothetical protein K1516_14455 [Stenotrophomonas maltophilia]